MKKILLFSLVGLVLVGGSVAGTLFFTGAFNESDAAVVQAEDGEESAPKPKPNAVDAKYLEFDPDFTVNFAGESRTRYMQIDLVAVAYDDKAIEALELHMPVVRNDLLLLFGDQNSDQLRTREGKESLRKQALATIHDVMNERFGEQGIEDVYFTRFVMQ